MTGHLDQADLARMARGGLSPMPTAEALRLLDIAVAGTQSLLLPARLDLPAVRAQAGEVPALFRGLVRLSGLRRELPSTEERPVLLERLTAARAADRRRVLATYLDEQARLTLGLDPQVPVEPSRPLGELGLDSLLAIELRNSVGAAIGCVLPPTALYDYPTIEAFGAYLADEILNLPSSDAASEHDPAEDDIRQIPADEYDAALAEELAAVQALLNGAKQ